MSRAEVSVKTTIAVDLGDFTTRDLIDELESRGHIVDSDCAAELDTESLVMELAKREVYHFAEVPLDILIKALEKFGYPQELLQPLLEWNNQPFPTLAKLDAWKALCK